ncbi:MAG: hypothetical protein H6558_21670 [Lewinellaceae bacterium]|nr:hypothetical protein [Lewinellaceae bacterium]
MEALEILIFTRSLERIAATLIGGGAIYMAYKLFLHLPDVGGVQDNFRFRQYLSFHIVKIGMGAVFMMFGALIILFSFFKAPALRDMENRVDYSGFGNQPAQANQEQGLLEPEPFAGYFSILNTLPDSLDSNVTEYQARTVSLTLSRVKLNLMLAVWDEELWGDPVAFKNWVFGGEHLPPPPNTSAEAVRFFNHINRQD